ncbi:hypothetical protein IW136_002139 [Coemansia sp. RSA 678]|nr:hypothetical protein IW136_002139 [Coemansia sp. RSA 678]
MTQGSHLNDPPGGPAGKALESNNAKPNPLPAQLPIALGNASAGQAQANDPIVTAGGSPNAATAGEDMEMMVPEEQVPEEQALDEQVLDEKDTLREQAAELQSVIMQVLAERGVTEEHAARLGVRLASKEELAQQEQQRKVAAALGRVQSQHSKLQTTQVQLREAEAVVAKLKQELGEQNRELILRKKAAAEAMAQAEVDRVPTASEQVREMMAAEKAAEQAAEIERLKKGLHMGGQWQGSKMPYAQAARMGSGQQRKQVWPAARQGLPQKQKEQPAPPPLAGDVQAAQKRTPPPKWAEDSQQSCAALTVTGLAGKGVSRTQLKSVLRMVMSYQLWINLVLRNKDTVQIIVRQENWGYVVEALKKKGLTPLPALKPWEVIPKGPTDYEQARTETREHWDLAYLTENTGASGALARWILANIPVGEDAECTPRVIRTPKVLLEEGQIDEAGEGPGFSTQQLGRRYRSVNPGELPAPMAMAVDDNSFAVLQEWSDDPMDEDEKGRGAKRGRIDTPKSKPAGEQGNLEGEETHENSNLARPSASAQGIPADHCPGPVGAGQLSGSSC